MHFFCENVIELFCGKIMDIKKQLKNKNNRSFTEKKFIFSVLFFILMVAKLFSQNFYWENPKIFVNNDSYFPVVIKNSQKNFVFWEEVNFQKKEIYLSCRVYNSFDDYSDTRRFAGPFGYSGNDVPHIYSAAVLEKGNVCVSVASQSGDIFFYNLSDNGKSFKQLQINTNEIMVAPRIFADSNDDFRVFTTVGKDNAFSIYTSTSKDGENWTEFIPFSPSQEISNSFIPVLQKTEQGDVVIFQAQYFSDETNKISYQLFLTKGISNNKSEWTEPILITDGFSLPAKSKNQFYDYQNQRADILQFNGQLYCTWERTDDTNTSVWVASIGENSTDSESVYQITNKADASRPILFEYDSNLYVTWFDNRSGREAVFMAKKSGNYWEEIEITSDKNSNMFVYPMMINGFLSFVWQQNKRIILLAPDSTVLQPKLKPLTFTEGKKTNNNKLQVQIIFPQDSSEIAGYSYTFDRKDFAEIPSETIEYFPKDDVLKLNVMESAEYLLSVRIADYAGNWSEPVHLSYLADFLPPVIPKINITNLDEYGFINSNNFNLAWDASESADTAGYVYRLDYAGSIPKSIAVSKNHPMKIKKTEVLQIKDNLFKKYEKELSKKRTINVKNVTTKLNTNTFYNYKNGVYVFSLAAIDDCGNMSETTSELIILNKYQPQTYINSVETKINETNEIILTINGGGFTYDGKISKIYIDTDGNAPYDMVLTQTDNKYKIISDNRIEKINLGSDLQEGKYKIGLYHTDRGLYFSKDILQIEQSGTVKIESEYIPPQKFSTSFKNFKYNIVLNLAISFIIIILVTIALFFLITVFVHNYSENKLISMEIKSLQKGEVMPLMKNKKQKKLPSLKNKLIVFIYILVVIIVLAVTLQNGIRIINLQEQTMANALVNRVNVLLESLCTGVKNFFPVNNLLELAALPNQKNAMEEVKYITIIGQKQENETSDNLNYVWATNDEEILKKIDTPSLIYGESELNSPEINEITKRFINLDNDIANDVSEYSGKIEKLTKQAEMLYQSTKEEDLLEAERLSQTVMDLRNEIDFKLTQYSNKAAGSYPYFDLDNIDRKNKNFIFYRPVLYRQGVTENYVHAVVYLELSTQILIDEINYTLYRIIRFGILIALVAVCIGGLGAYFFASIIVRPIKKLESHVVMIGQTKNKLHLKGKDVDIKHKDEIGRLGQAVNNMTHELIANAEEEKLTMDGKAVQKAFLPLVDAGVNNKNTIAEYSDKNVECYGYYEGESGVSGDYFDYKKLDESWFCIIKCDAAGHGIPAAIIMTVVATIFRRYFNSWTYKKDGTKLNVLVEQINDFIEGLGLKGKFATLIICLLNLQTGELYMCNAGDNLVHIFDSETRKMKTLKLSSTPTAGIFTSDLIAMKGGFTVEKTVLKQNDVLFLYTDGIEESTRKIRNQDYVVQKNNVEIKKMNPVTHKEETEIKLEDAKEEFGYERIASIIEAVYNKRKYVLTKKDNPNRAESLEFDFTKCEGTVKEAILALASIEKVFRLYKTSQTSQTDYVKIDKKIDEFLLKYFNIYNEYAAKKSENVENSINYIDYDMVLEDEQSDDLTLLAIKVK